MDQDRPAYRVAQYFLAHEPTNRTVAEIAVFERTNVETMLDSRDRNSAPGVSETRMLYAMLSARRWLAEVLAVSAVFLTDRRSRRDQHPRIPQPQSCTSKRHHRLRALSSAMS